MSEEQKNSDKKYTVTEEVREYIEKRVQLLSITIAEQVSLIIAHSLQRLLGMFVLACAVFFLWFGVGFLIGELIGSLSAGFAIASLPLFIAAFIFMNRRSKRVTEKIQAELIGKILDNFENDEDLKQIEGKTTEQE